MSYINPFSHSLTSSLPFPTTDSGNMCIYICQYIRKHTYICTCVPHHMLKLTNI